MQAVPLLQAAPLLGRLSLTRLCMTCLIGIIMSLRYECCVLVSP